MPKRPQPAKPAQPETGWASRPGPLTEIGWYVADRKPNPLYLDPNFGWQNNM